ncbi:MAG: DUF4097 family beta strand repeat protein [Clostridia bacterium]|nr:DUF4097 family beta strand repeat protein [Clostridia bacterium]
MKITKAIANKILMILLIVFGGLTLVGGGVFTIVMAAADWDFTVMNTVDYVYQEYTERHKVTSLTLDFDVSNIKVYFDESTTQVRVEYPETYSKKGKLLTKTTVTEENNALKIEQERISFVHTSFYVGKNPCVNVYMPKAYAYALDLKTDTGDVRMSGYATLESLKIETDTGTIDLGGTIVCDGKIDLSTDTGNIFLNAFTSDSLFIEVDTGNVTLDGHGSVMNTAEITTDTGNVSILHTLSSPTLKIETDTGNVHLGNLSGTNLTVQTDTGNIKSIGTSLLDFITLNFSADTGNIIITLVGEIGDYSIQAHTNTGNNNLYDYPDPTKTKTLKIYTGTGNIKGIFQPKFTEK